MLKFEDFINEKQNQSPIEDKDWDRMTDLVLKGDEGNGIASTIKDKRKAIARFVAGEKLNGSTVFDFSYGYCHGFFRSFGDKAIDLGATPDEIQKVFDEAQIPSKFADKLANLSGKNLANRFVGEISRLVLKLGFDIKYIKTNGYALTYQGRDAMNRNGVKWTIGYKAEITGKGKKFLLAFDAITNERVDPMPTYYVFSSESSSIFSNYFGEDPIGIQKFLSEISESLSK